MAAAQIGPADWERGAAAQCRRKRRSGRGVAQGVREGPSTASGVQEAACRAFVKGRRTEMANVERVRYSRRLSSRPDAMHESASTTWLAFLGFFGAVRWWGHQEGGPRASAG